MNFPRKRMRRLRQEKIRDLVRETKLSVSDFIYPLFVCPGENVKREIPSMPGIYHMSIDKLQQEVKEIAALGIPGVILFGIPSYKDEIGSEAYHPKGIIQKAVNAIKKVEPQLLVITDVCLCQYTTHGHCGVVDKGKILNDQTLELLAKVAVSQAEAGADIVAPSDMMDGRVLVIRDALDKAGFSEVSIMAYSIKYCSSFYGPFREAADSAPRFGDRSTYQMDPSNIREAIQEALLDIAEGADILMVKPAMAYLDVVRVIRELVSLPLAAYNVSGEFAMVKAADRAGWIDGQRLSLEILTSIKRAGADIIITYHAKEAALFLK